MKQAKRNIDVISQHATEGTITDWNAPVKQANNLSLFVHTLPLH